MTLKNLTKFTILFIGLVTLSCKKRDFNSSEVATVKQAPADCASVIYITDADFKKKPHPERANLMQRVSEVPEIDLVLAKLNIPKTQSKDWILRGVSALNGDYCEFSNGDLFSFKANTDWIGQSYFDFSAALFKTFDAARVKEVYNQIHNNPADPVFDSALHPDLAILTAANIWIQKHEIHQYLIDVSGKEKTGQNGWLYPITEEEANNAKNSELGGVLEIKDFRTTPGVMMGVPIGPGTKFGAGYFMYYAKSEDLIRKSDGPGLLTQWEADAREAKEVTDTTEFQTRIARLFRRCIANHTFLDGNGRSCHVWAFNTLAQRGIPHPLLWANQDVLVEKNEWISRWNTGIENHKKFISKLWLKNL